MRNLFSFFHFVAVVVITYFQHFLKMINLMKQNRRNKHNPILLFFFIKYVYNSNFGQFFDKFTINEWDFFFIWYALHLNSIHILINITNEKNIGKELKIIQFSYTVWAVHLRDYEINIWPSSLWKFHFFSSLWASSSWCSWRIVLHFLLLNALFKLSKYLLEIALWANVK